ncbi:MAG: phosphoglycerate kinase [Hyphomicrobiaceae bacterium]
MILDNLRSIDTADVANKRVLVRADLNVPVRDGAVSDATRLARLVPGLVQLADRRAKIILVSHFGRPKGKRIAELSLRTISEKLAELVGRPVLFAEDCVGLEAEKAVAELAPGEILVLENLRFHPGEEENDAGFAKELANLAEIYVNDAFSAAHRAHASTEGVARLLPRYAGPLMIEEITALRSALDQPDRPTAAIVGGAKVSTKIPVLTNMVSKVDKLIIGGGMANTFLLAQGVAIGNSLSEPDFCSAAIEIVANARASACEIVLPVDAVIAEKFEAGAASQVVDLTAIPDTAMVLDVGPSSVAAMTELLRGCKTLLWNGPLGAFEIEPFGAGTFALAKVAAELTRSGNLTSIAGGGDTVAALNAAGVTDDFTYVSTAGGAFLEWLEGRELPGIAALTA